MSRFADVQTAPPIEVFALTRGFNADQHPKKVNLGVGAYRSEEGKPWVLPVVRKLEVMLAADETLNHEYLPVLGLDALSKAAVHLLLGTDCPAVIENRAIGVQALSGTGALYIGALFLRKILGYDTYYYSQPTWGNHKLIFDTAGFKQGRAYRYWDPKTKNIDFDGMCEDLRQAPENSVVILHACAHNPTGCDPTDEQWKQLCEIIREKKLFPFFDSAYQGFASGDPDKDAKAVRHFAKEGLELFCSQSFSKNFGLYNERVGNLTVVMSDPELAAAVQTQLTLVVRATYSNPPAHGARVVAATLTNKDLFAEWQDCIKVMSARIIQMREALRDRLVKLGTPGTWDHITRQIGMFSFTGLTPQQCEYLISEHHIYMLRSGRANMAGLSSANLDHVAAAIHDAVTKFPA
ncbi:aspartate aminotransferase, cytoplasmic-like [Pollicipes pollicipes]|uniref:aspartate aminotransferase, cytoplasmic-like n=1 Tax=Pollicipes pollicipes TaxID=41117 RepID=UPI0018852A37|nr:aspartate aminotransferase, cytoplasmic-like [Pollicipes pollicipes]XP_037068129.1 aspartate aminotransferase, cytoplasmic-like [Pollicipes pollicipes]